MAVVLLRKVKTQEDDLCLAWIINPLSTLSNATHISNAVSLFRIDLPPINCETIVPDVDEDGVQFVAFVFLQ